MSLITEKNKIKSDVKIALLKSMKKLRYFEERSIELYGELKIRGFLHLYIGEEAVGAGVLSAIHEGDQVVSTYREHGHALMKGVSGESILLEMFGKKEGCCRGRGGSMHLFDIQKGFWGGSAIVAGGLPVAVGLALSQKMKKSSNITLCFFGDGAVAEGEFHESLNLAALWKLPVLFICENNQYAMGTALERHQSQVNIAKKAQSYNITSEQIDGMNVLSVYEATQNALTKIRETKEPYFLECITYRFRAHSMYDSELYRSKEEVAQWKQKDPILQLTESLVHESLLTHNQIEDMNLEVKNEIEKAIKIAEEGQLESVSDLEKYVYYNSDAEGRSL